MSTTRLPRVALFVPAAALLCLILFRAAAPARAGSIVRVWNDSDTARTLSDLIVYGDNDQKKTILALNNAADDILVGGREVRTFDAGFEVRKYFVSETVGGTSEWESSRFNVTTQNPRYVGFFSDENSGSPLVPSVDDTHGAASPAAGTLVSFVNGVSPTLPGWFMGTGVNLETGQVTGAFTGQGRVTNTFWETAIIPEPTALTLGIVVAALSELVRRRRRGDRPI